jgi:hypothetical protein
MGTLVAGHTLSADVMGTITAKGSTPNTVNKESITIVDENGNDVSSNYEYEDNITLGTLTVI